MTDELAPKPAKTTKPRGAGVPFKKGYDPRRWLAGRGVKSPEQREGEKILRAVIWKELSREFDAASGKPLESEEKLTALELAVRNEIKKRFNNIADRIAGKVENKLDLTNSDGNLKPPQIIEVIRTVKEDDSKPD